MSGYDIGDLVVLKSGSMRMCVEGTDESGVRVVWCHEGVIGRDVFDAALLNKWEFREDSGSRGGDRPGPRGAGTGKPYHGDREGGGKRYGGDRDSGGGGGGGYRGGRDRDQDDRPPRKTGWDGKPRDKKYYRNDG